MLCFVCLATAAFAPAAGALDDMRSVWNDFDRPGLGTEELLFYVPFEADCQPAYARGSREVVNLATLRKQAQSIRVGEGIRGKCLEIGDAPFSVLYHTAKNIAPREGTVSLWVKPNEWEKVKGGHIVPGSFFWMRWNQSYPKLMLANNRSYTRALYFGSKRDVVKANLMGEAGKFRFSKTDKGKWYHLAVVWSPTAIQGYVNGEPCAQTTGSFAFSRDIDKHFRVGVPKFSSIDEVKVFGRALSHTEIEALYAFATSPVPAPRVCAPFMRRAPTVDGVYDEAEWRAASGITGLIDVLTGQVASHPVRARLGYDTECLYLAFLWDVPEEVRNDITIYGQFGSLTHDVGDADGPVWKDDSFDILLAPKQRETFRLVVNDRRALYDAKNGDITWRSRARIGSRADLERWVLELAVPLAALGGAKEGDTWRFNVTRHGRMAGLAYESLYTDGRSAEPVAGAELVFGRAGQAVCVERIGDMKDGALDVSASLPAGCSLRIGYDSRFADALARLTPGRGGAAHHAADVLKGANRLFLLAEDAGGRVLHRQALPYAFSQQGWLSCQFIPSADRIELKAYAAGAEAEWNHRLDARILRDKTELLKQRTSFKGSSGQMTVDTREVPSGKYALEATVTRGADTILAQTFDFQKKKSPQWMGSNCGDDDIVLKPWTPISRQGNVISVWNRSFEYDKRLFFPKRIVSGGGDVLARPVEFRIDGEPVRGVSRITSVSDTRADRVANGRAGTLDVALSARLEYDGMEWYSFQLTPRKKPAAVDDVRLVIPFEKGVAELYYKSLRDAGLFRKMPKKAPFPRYMLMVRNDLCGLIWFTESQEGYNLERPNECFEWEETEDAIELTIHIIDHRFDITGARRVSFGFMTTPIRPNWKGRRRLRIGKLGAEHEAPPPIANWQFWWQWAGMPKESDPARVASGDIVRPRNVLLPPYDDLHDKYAEWKRKGVTPLAYFMGTGVCPFIPEYRYYQEEWRIDPYPRPNLDADPNPRAHTRVCSYSTFQDFFFSKLKPGIEGTLFQGAHVDLAGPQLCKNAHHGCGYVDDNGQRRPRFTYLGTREFFRRFNTILQQVHGDDRPTLLEGHPNPNLLPCGFLDCTVAGENYVVECGRHGSYHWIPLDRFRAVMAPHTGIMNVLLTQFARSRPEEKEAWYTEEKKPIVEHLCGLVLAHDAQVWPGTSINTPYREMWAALDEFGWDDAVEFLPYWRNGDYVSVQGGADDLVVSLFKRDGRLLAVVLNHTAKNLTPTITLNLKALGLTNLSDATPYDPIAKKDCPLARGRLAVPMGAWSYRMLILCERRGG